MRRFARETSWLRKWLNRNGYVLVSVERMRSNQRLERSIQLSREAENEMRRRLSESQERVMVLEAEVEAHKRIETVLAERALRGHRMNPALTVAKVFGASLADFLADYQAAALGEYEPMRKWGVDISVQLLAEAGVPLSQFVAAQLERVGE